MSRRRKAEKRVLIPEPKYGSELLAKFINSLMISGKKACAEKIVYGALEHAAEKTKISPLEIFESVLEKIKPEVEVRTRRIGGSSYPIPTEVRPDRAIGLAMRWLVECSRKRGERNMASRLGAEFLEVLEDRGESLKKREEIHKIAKANRAFAHYRF